jgi:hypothetical protein
MNPEQFANIEADPVLIKPTDSRAKKFIEQYGPTCYELDAFHPVELRNLVERHIERFTDLDSVSCNYEQQIGEIEFLENLKSKVTDFVLGEIGY